MILDYYSQNIKKEGKIMADKFKTFFMNKVVS